jgi:hypothetical protein
MKTDQLVAIILISAIKSGDRNMQIINTIPRKEMSSFKIQGGKKGLLEL